MPNIDEYFRPLDLKDVERGYKKVVKLCHKVEKAAMDRLMPINISGTDALNSIEEIIILTDRDYKYYMDEYQGSQDIIDDRSLIWY